MTDKMRSEKEAGQQNLTWQQNVVLYMKDILFMLVTIMFSRSSS